MMLLIRRSLAAFVLLAAPLLRADDRPAAKPAGDVGKAAPANAFQGRLVGIDVDGRKLTLSDVTMLGGKQGNPAAATTTFAVSEHARIWLDGREAQLRDLHEGFSVRVETRLGNAPAGRAKISGASHEVDDAGLRTVDLIDARSR